MIERLALRIPFLASVLSLFLAVPGVRADVPGAGSVTNLPALAPGPADGRIAFLAARMLEQFHYAKMPFDNSVSSKFLDRYLKTLDPQNMHFTAVDIAQFERLRAVLDDYTVGRRGASDSGPAYEIFNRFVQRLQQRAAYAEELLKSEKFTFQTDERVVVNREEMPYPKDLDEARKLWKERLRFEYLQELLGKIAAKKIEKAESATNAPAKKFKNDDEEIVDTLTHRYVRNVKTFRDFDADDVLQVYLTALAHVYDPHSDYLGRDQLESFEIGMNLSLFGIGAELRSEDGYCTINRLLPGGPATKSGLIKEKDRIITVGQSNQPPVDVIDMNLNKAVQLIRGPKGTEVRLTVIPAGKDASSKKTITLIRDEIPLEDQAAKARIIETVGTSGDPIRMGLIDLPSFYASFDASNTRGKTPQKSTAADVAKLLQKLKQENVTGIILDLRRNGGGSLEEAIRVTGLFIKQGTVVQVKDSDGSIERDNDVDPSVQYEGPLIVLTSRFSASASEILAGALQDYGRALIVGDASTHGKGTVQSVNSLRPYLQFSGKPITNDPGALKITIKKFYRASGASTQLKGVSPDVALPSVLSESKDFGESSLDNPMAWDTIPSASFERLDRVAPYLAELRRRSTTRLKEDPEYRYIREDIELFKKQQADKSFSLNLSQRLKEKQEADARQKARDKERLARAESQDKVYEITLKLAERPGLPAPLEKTNLLSKAHSAMTPDLPAADGAEEDAKAPPVDAYMAEAQRILRDYVALLSRNNVAAASPAPVRTSSGVATKEPQSVTR